MSHDPWTVNFTTHSRDEALRMADFMARAFEPRFFYDPDCIPLIAVTGGFNNGKSMICEAMTRSLLDQENLYDMLQEGQRFHHYLENRPSEALWKYCYKSGTIDGVQAVISFDRLATALKISLPLDEEFQENFKYYPFMHIRQGFQLVAGNLKQVMEKRRIAKTRFCICNQPVALSLHQAGLRCCRMPILG